MGFCSKKHTRVVFCIDGVMKIISNNIYRGRSFRKAFGILALILSLAGSAGAATWTVDDSGGADYTKIQSAIDNASAGDTIYVYSGIYYENIVINKGIFLQGERADVTTIDGRGIGDAISNCNDNFNCIGISSFAIDGFTIKSYDATALRFYSKTTTISGIIKNNIVKDSAYGINAGLNCNLEIINNLIYNNRNSANTDGNGVDIAFNTPYGVSSIIKSNTIVDNYHGIWVYNANTVIVNNIVVNNSGGQNVESTGIDHHGGGTIYISYNDVYGNDVNYRADASPGLGDISIDPIFIYPTTNDYHLLAGSPCIDAGTNEGAPSTDFDGNLRPIDGDGDGIAIVDIGAFEYIPSGSISGFKINDTNGNGKWDEGEKGISNWTVRLIGINGIRKNTKVIRKETLTDAMGFYKFDNLQAARYIIIEKFKKGFVPTSSPVKRIKLAQDENFMNNNFTNRPVHSLVIINDQRDVDNYEAINRDIDKYIEDMD